MDTVVVEPLKTVAQLEPVDTSDAEKYENGLQLHREVQAFRRLGTIGYDGYVTWINEQLLNR